VSRWDKAVHDQVAPPLRNRLGIAVGGVTYAAYRQLLDGDRWQRLADQGAWPQRLLWASTGTKDPDAPDCLYVEALAAPGTVNTLPEKTLRAFVDHGRVRDVMATDGVAAQATLQSFADAGIDLDALAQRLQHDGAQSFAKSWQQLMQRIAEKRRQWLAA
jgi:transaldolase